jgi:hypothetical protein
MIVDIVLIIVSAVLGLIHVILLIPDTLFSIGNFNIIIAQVIGFMFTPLRFFGYWIDLVTLGKCIDYAMIFLAIWFTVKLVFMTIGFIPGVSTPSIEKIN